MLSLYHKSIIVLHPLSYGRGDSLPIFNFLSEHDTYLRRVKLITICRTTATLLSMSYSDSGWPKPLPSVCALLYSKATPDDLISPLDPEYSKVGTLKHRFNRPNRHPHDSIITYSRHDKEMTLYKDIFYPEGI